MTYAEMSGMIARIDRQLEEDELYDILSNERRRLCVRTIQENRDSIDVQELADTLASELADGSMSSNLRQSIYISLVQTHLPKLDKYEVVDYDDDEKTVRAGQRLPEVDGYLLDDANDHRELVIAAGVCVSSVAAAAALFFVYGSVDPTSRTVVSVAIVLQALVIGVVLKEYVGLPEVGVHR